MSKLGEVFFLFCLTEMTLLTVTIVVLVGTAVKYSLLPEKKKYVQVLLYTIVPVQRDVRTVFGASDHS